MTLSCPHCQSHRCRLTSRRTWGERLRNIINTYTFRCRTCGKSFRKRIRLRHELLQAICPRCLSQNLTQLPAMQRELPQLALLQYRLGGKLLRCASCRHHFVTYRPLRRRGATAGAAAVAPYPSPATTSHPAPEPE